MPKFTDQIGRTFRVRSMPERIVSLVPSLTELLCTIGLEDTISGRTKFCIHPERIVKKIKKVGGTKNPHIREIIDMAPDLVIANKEENKKGDIEHLSPHVPVYVSNILSIPDLYAFIMDLGRIFNIEAKCTKLIEEIKEKRAGYMNAKKHSGKVCYLIWKKPWMTIGHDTFINTMIEEAGFISVTKHLVRYPQLEEDTIRTLNPDYIFLSSEPYPFKEKHIEAMQPVFPNATIVLVDGSIFSWYGSRVLMAYPYFENLQL